MTVCGQLETNDGDVRRTRRGVRRRLRTHSARSGRSERIFEI